MPSSILREYTLRYSVQYIAMSSILVNLPPPFPFTSRPTLFAFHMIITLMLRIFAEYRTEYRVIVLLSRFITVMRDKRELLSNWKRRG